jgi:hypothetical protein
LFFRGVALFAGFVLVLVFLFLPVFDGQSALNRLDSFYNSIAKGSAYFIPQLKEQVSKFDGRAVRIDLVLASGEEAAALARLITQCGAKAEAMSARVKVDGDLGRILAGCLRDSDDMFHNRGGEVRSRYGVDEKRAVFHWWKALKAMEKGLKKQAEYAEAEVVLAVCKKGVECAYNFYGIEYERISDNLWIVLFSLVFYVIYTIWYGFALMYMFEGYGLKLSH